MSTGTIRLRELDAETSEGESVPAYLPSGMGEQTATTTENVLSLLMEPQLLVVLTPLPCPLPGLQRRCEQLEGWSLIVAATELPIVHHPGSSVSENTPSRQQSEY